jgi:hypothetical protein
MGTLHKFQAEILADGVISKYEVSVIQEYIEENGLDLADIKLLVHLQAEAREVCQEFDDLLFPALKKVLLEDGRIGLDEQYYLLKSLCADGRVSERERKFIVELRDESREVSPEFESFCEQVLSGTL